MSTQHKESPWPFIIFAITILGMGFLSYALSRHIGPWITLFSCICIGLSSIVFGRLPLIEYSLAIVITNGVSALLISRIPEACIVGGVFSGYVLGVVLSKQLDQVNIDKMELFRFDDEGNLVKIAETESQANSPDHPKQDPNPDPTDDPTDP